ELVGATDEGRQLLRRIEWLHAAGGGFGQYPVHRPGIVEALEIQFSADRLKIEPVAHDSARRVADEHRSRIGARLQPDREMNDISDRYPARDGDLSGGNPDSHPDAEPADGAEDLASRPQRSGGAV